MILVKILKDAGRIVRKEILASSDVYSSWPPTGQELLAKKFEVPFTQRYYYFQYLLAAT